MTHLRLCMICGLLSLAGFLLSINGCGGGNVVSAPPQPVPSIQHIVVIFQENRTPDNLFHDPVLIARGADIAQSGLNSLGQTIALTPTSLSGDYDLDHSHKAFEAMYDNGKMDGANLVSVMCNGETCPKSTVVPPNPQYFYVQASDVTPYFRWRSSTRSVIACFRPIKVPASLPTSSSFPAPPPRARAAIFLPRRMGT